MLSFSPQDVLDEILNLIESVSEGFHTNSWCISDNRRFILVYMFSSEMTKKSHDIYKYGLIGLLLLEMLFLSYIDIK